ncbi:MAG: glycine/sarcosine/betaine reductase component B subunit [Thermomicrobiales bacterium]
MSLQRSFVCNCPVLPLPGLVHEFVPVGRVEAGPRAEMSGVALRLPPVDPAWIAGEPLVVVAALDIIPPDGRDIQTDTIMDVMPIAAKREGVLGAGVTRVARGVVLLLTGRDESGEPVGEFGHSAGILSERMANDAPGAPDLSDWIIRVAVTLRAGTGMERPGPLAAHRLADRVAEGLRAALLAAPDAMVAERRAFEGERPGGLRVVLVKEVMGQGAMHDNLLLPREPGGVAGGRSVIDLGNLPVVLRPNELRDGALHSLCCVGPSTKETKLHSFRDPLVADLADDPQVDLIGVIVVGSPAAEADKRFVAERIGAAVHAMAPDGAMVATEGFGNNHIDYAVAIREIAAYGTPCVGVTWAARQGQLVVGNEYMVAMIEVNGSGSGTESRVLAENTARPADARRAAAMLKTVMAGIDVLPAPAAWDPAVAIGNAALVEDAAAAIGGITSPTAGLRSEVPSPAIQPVPLTPLEMPLSRARIALVTASGAHETGQEPFDRAGDHSLREIPAGAPRDRIVFASGGYDHTDVNRDPNCMFPLDPLRALVAEGAVGGMTEAHVGFQGGGGDPERIRSELGPALLGRLRAMHADAVLLTGG